MDMRSPATKTLSLTDAAAEQIKSLMASQAPDAIGLRVGVRSKGCSGLAYAMEFAKTLRDDEEVVEDKGVKLFVEPSAVMYIIGSELDYKKTDFEESFVFENPNKTGGCGCGESFSTADGREGSEKGKDEDGKGKSSASTGGGCASGGCGCG
jgi:iron-sulfur cluster assembly protein